jgi:hypothetical protein
VSIHDYIVPAVALAVLIVWGLGLAAGRASRAAEIRILHQKIDDYIYQLQEPPTAEELQEWCQPYEAGRPEGPSHAAD